jgi:uncharacterized protein YvpB
MTKLVYVAFSACVLLCSCNRADKRPKYDPNFVMPDLRPKPLPANNGKPVSMASPVNQPQAAPAPANAAKLSNVPLNPAHGQPGHRCDIAVGAPLGNAPAPAIAKPVSNVAPVPTPVSATQAANNAPVAKGMNPAHGQPGHRCDIAVGAPLNSKPAPVAQAPATAATTVAAPAPVKVAKGMNPSHGQPGHRCDIAVGAPLNSKPNPPKTVTPAAPVVEPVKEVPKDNN